MSLRRTPGMRLALLCAVLGLSAFAQPRIIVWSKEEKPIDEQLGRLRSLPDAERASTTERLAIQIRRLPVTANKAMLAQQLANLATEGDPGHGALQEVATTLAETLREQPAGPGHGEPAMPYVT